MNIPEGYFKDKYGPLTGRDWLKDLPEYERSAFSRIGFAASGYGIIGGMVRAETAERDELGRFASVKSCTG